MNGIIDKLRSEFDGVTKSILNVLDILLIAAALYFLFLFLHKHNSSRLIKIIVISALVFALLLSDAMGMTMLGKLAQTGIIIIVICLTLLFPQEMRRTLFKLSSPKGAAEIFNTEYDCSDEELKKTVDEIVRASQNMAKKNVGALMIVAPKPLPYNLIESGTKLDAVLSSSLLESIFNTKAPLHDGAVFIRGNRIIAAGCFLSLAQNAALDKELGTRHRAAIGVTETNNVLAIIVSEETGIISVALGGEIQRYYDSAMLHEKLEEVYGLRAIAANGRTKRLRKRKNN